ncbi:MAG: toll/interleukin-1 receptor domain-containing protein [Syntrophobacteraceae bacterium]
MTPEELQGILKRHRLWLEEEGGERADLSGADLSRADLSRAYLIGANLGGAYLPGANLSGADVSGADLTGADLNRADLSGADLTEADLSVANLREADLAGADLNVADLGGADLSGADLSGADLAGANLAGANLSTANLIEANLEHSEVGWTTFADMDLGGALGLDKVIHKGPSTIGVDTLRLSEGKIPEEFLRGCGLSDWEIKFAKLYQPDLAAAQINDLLYEIFPARTADHPIQFYSCFISYSHDDKVFARKLHDRLQSEGIRCWLDEHQLLPGDDIHEQVDRGIRLWDKVLLCCSENSLTSWWVDSEIEKAFRKEQRLMKERGTKALVLIPLNLDGYMFTDQWEDGKKTAVQSRLAADFTGWETDECVLENQIERLIKALRAGDAGREPPPKPRI